MVIVELIGSLSVAIAFVSAITLTVLHIKHKQNDITYIHDHSLNNRRSSVLPFEEFNQAKAITSASKTTINKELSIINVINNDEISLSLVKYGIQWALPPDEDTADQIVHSPMNIQKPFESEQTDALSFGDQATNVRDLIIKFENNSLRKNSRKEKNNLIDSDLTSIDTNIDNQTLHTDRNQNRQKISHHSSISNLDVTIPSNLSSSIDLEQFECVSTTSNLSEVLHTN